MSRYQSRGLFLATINQRQPICNKYYNFEFQPRYYLRTETASSIPEKHTKLNLRFHHHLSFVDWQINKWLVSATWALNCETIGILTKDGMIARQSDPIQSSGKSVKSKYLCFLSCVVVVLFSKQILRVSSSCLSDSDSFSFSLTKMYIFLMQSLRFWAFPCNSSIISSFRINYSFNCYSVGDCLFWFFDSKKSSLKSCLLILILPWCSSLFAVSFSVWSLLKLCPYGEKCSSLVAMSRHWLTKVFLMICFVSFFFDSTLTPLLSNYCCIARL